ncbi:hypothetical protein M404DRAFT_32191 [Pisolithus tinctorius Marx 270]|uniref:Uncharacterized protein n=1 Tax=Pisolithus tinctorius Marx 270 TaxID=870435 RepID=A0A0C3NQJ4_PISTI|nr:hypothetical protein M404DRAFT_32191 [Pisolithus tinctorius Marx 270]
MAVRRKRSAMKTTELERSKFCFGPMIVYLHLRYSREVRCLQQTTVAVRGTTTTLLSADKRPYEIGSAVRWDWGARSADTEPYGSKVHFDFETLYLHLRYSRENGYTRRHPSYIQATAILGATAVYEERQTRSSRLELQQRSSKIRDPTDMGTERDSPSLYFSRATFYSQIGYSRIDDDFEETTYQPTERQVRRLQNATRNKFEATLWNCTQDLIRIAAQQRDSKLRLDIRYDDVEEGMRLYTALQRISKSQQDARHAESSETMPAGLNGPKFGNTGFYKALRNLQQTTIEVRQDEREDYRSSYDSNRRGYDIQRAWIWSQAAQVFIFVSQILTYGHMILE